MKVSHAPIVNSSLFLPASIHRPTFTGNLKPLGVPLGAQGGAGPPQVKKPEAGKPRRRGTRVARARDGLSCDWTFRKLGPLKSALGWSTPGNSRDPAPAASGSRQALPGCVPSGWFGRLLVVTKSRGKDPCQRRTVMAVADHTVGVGDTRAPRGHVAEKRRSCRARDFRSFAKLGARAPPQPPRPTRGRRLSGRAAAPLYQNSHWAHEVRPSGLQGRSPFSVVCSERGLSRVDSTHSDPRGSGKEHRQAG